MSSRKGVFHELESQLVQTNVPGRVRNTSLRPYRVLQAVFEAISNSMQAIHDSGEVGAVGIALVRGGDPSLVAGANPIVAVRITDSGIGFNDTHFFAFNEAETAFREAIGGKGMGRFLWLKAFQYAGIESTYLAESGWRSRRFRFTLTHHGIEGLEDIPSKSTARSTSVTLANPHPEYAAHLPKSGQVFAVRIVEHFLPLFFHSQCPRLTVTDEDNPPINLNQLFANEFAQHSTVKDFSAGGHALTIRHIMNPGMGDYQGNHIHFCAAQRSVQKVRLSQLDSRFPTSKIFNNSTNESFYYVGLISGAILDTSASPDRGEFDIPDESLPGISLSQHDLREATAEAVHAFLGDHLVPLRRSQIERIQNLAAKEPQYHYLLRYHRDEIDRIPADVTDEAALDSALRKIECRSATRSGSWCSTRGHAPALGGRLKEVSRRICALYYRRGRSGQRRLSQVRGASAGCARHH